MSNVLNHNKQQQVIALGRLGWSLRRIERETGVRRETAGAYLRIAGVALRPQRGRRRPKPASEVTPEVSLGCPPAGHEQKTKPAKEVTTDFGRENQAVSSSSGAPVLPQRSPSASACEPYRDSIELGVSRGRNAMAIWQDLVSQLGFAHSYQSVKRFLRKLENAPPPSARCVITTSPGEEAQVDYGTGPMVRDPLSGKYRRTRLFVMTLGHSRKAVRLLAFRSSARVWAELHEQAFRRLGGATRVVVLDNLREGVLTPDIYHPTLNPLYHDVLAHYGAIAMPCRVNDPDRKGKVERGVGHAKQTPLKGLRFESLQEAQAYLDDWERRWADTRIHGTTKRQVAAMFAEERAALLPLPLEPFRYYQYGERTVHLDGCAEVEAAYYGAPPGWIGRRVHVQWSTVWVRLLDPKTGQLLREHFRQKPGAHAIKPEDRPKQTPLSTQQLLARAAHAGAHLGQLCHALYQRQGQAAVRRIQGVLACAKKFGLAATEHACATALEMGIPEYRFVKRYLEHGPQLSLTLRQVDPLIRELQQYRDFIEQHTQTQEMTP